MCSGPFFNALSKPKNLEEVGFGREQLDKLATNSLQGHFLHTIPVPLKEKEQVLKNLELFIEFLLSVEDRNTE